MLLPGSMTAAFRGVAWRGRGWFRRHFLSTLFKMSLCAAKLVEGGRGDFSRKWEGREVAIREHALALDAMLGRILLRL